MTCLFCMLQLMKEYNMGSPSKSIINPSYSKSARTQLIFAFRLLDYSYYRGQVVIHDGSN